MRCLLCGRQLRAATAWTLGKPVGPQCAKRQGIKRTPMAKMAKPTPAPVDARQLALQLEAAC